SFLRGIAGQARNDSPQAPVTGNWSLNTVFRFTHSFSPAENCLIQVVFDGNVNLADTATCVWLLGNNVDPARDCRMENNMLIVDATGKRKGSNGFTRPWPNVVCAATETIAAVDKKWSNLGLGKFIPSPSLRYQGLQQGTGASVVVNG
ncbi:MAG: hypothetical protein LBU92_02065, partial [Prevotellaceae bacterium]|nr:hypothetical protein [Prevotellaceae bacterium]